MFAVIDPCLSQPCLNNGSCVLNNNGSDFTCNCQPQYFGATCQAMCERNCSQYVYLISTVIINVCPKIDFLYKEKTCETLVDNWQFFFKG